MFKSYKFAYFTLFALALGQFILALWLGKASFSRYFEERGFVRAMLPGWVIIPLIWSGAVAIKIAYRRVQKPFVAIRKIIYLKRHWLGRGVIFIGVVLFVARSISSFKSSIHKIVPYYADHWFVKADNFIFGVDPWIITHSIIGPLGTVFIDRVYALWFVIMMLYIGWFCFSRNQVLQIRGLLTYVLCWSLLGNISAVAFSSVGPCFYQQFYGNDRYYGLMSNLADIDSQYTLLAFRSMKFLIDAVGEDKFGGGISAMPSLHVAIAFLCFVVAWEYGRHWWARLLGFLFFVLIFIGSVHLGWHYAVDGIYSILGTSIIWWGTGRFVRWVERREAAQQAGPGEGAGVPVPA